MDWIQLTVVTTTEGSELVSEALMEAGSAGTMIVDKNDVFANQRPEGMWDIIGEEIAEKMGEDVKVTGYYAMDMNARDCVAAARERIAELKRNEAEYGIDFGSMECFMENVDEEDWAENWKKDFKPFRLGEHMVVKPGWEEVEVQPGDHIIEIDPGMAFGTGTHETTGMCVAMIEEHVKPGMSVIDIGTGTGILAIAAAHMGADPILATDLDHVAVRVAKENVEINGFADRIRVVEGDLLECVNETADVILTNIIADVLMFFAEPVRKHINKGGKFICSGISKEKRQGVIDVLNKAGYHILEIRDKGEWTAIVADRD